MEILEAIVDNAKKPRRETRMGREWLVAPVRMLPREGVLNGSKGAGFYPASENGRDPQAWNGMPIVAWHPQQGGIHVSARNPEILDNRGLGFVYNANFGNGLDAEAWFDVNAAQAVEKRFGIEVLRKVENGLKLELSTGLFTDNEAVENGIHQPTGKPYQWIARNHRPDHLAILPDQKGACSVNDGCGVNVNQSSSSTNKFLRIFWDLGESAMPTRNENVLWLTTNCDCHKVPAKVLNDANALSDAEIQALRANAEQRQQLELTANAFVRVANVVGVAKDATIEQAVEQVANAADAGCKKMQKKKPPIPGQAPPDEEEPPAMNAASVQKMIADAIPRAVPEYLKGLSVNDYFAMSPAPMQALFKQMIAADTAARAQVAEAIVANLQGDEAVKNAYKEWLNGKDLKELQMIAAPILAANQAARQTQGVDLRPPIFSGNEGGPGRGFDSAPVLNLRGNGGPGLFGSGDPAQTQPDNAPLEGPTLNWADEYKLRHGRAVG